MSQVQVFKNLQTVNKDDMNLFYDEKDVNLTSYFSNVPCIGSGIGMMVGQNGLANNFGQSGTTNTFAIVSGVVRFPDQVLPSPASSLSPKAIFVSITGSNVTIISPTSPGAQYYAVAQLTVQAVTNFRTSYTAVVSTTAMTLAQIAASADPDYYVPLFAITNNGAGVYVIDIDNNCAYNYNYLVTTTDISNGSLSPKFYDLTVDNSTTLNGVSTSINTIATDINSTTFSVNSTGTEGNLISQNSSGYTASFFTTIADASLKTQAYVNSGLNSDGTKYGQFYTRWFDAGNGVFKPQTGITGQNGANQFATFFTQGQDNGSSANYVGFYSAHQNYISSTIAGNQEFYSINNGTQMVGTLYVDAGGSTATGMQLFSGAMPDLIGSYASLDKTSAARFLNFQDILLQDGVDGGAYITWACAGIGNGNSRLALFTKQFDGLIVGTNVGSWPGAFPALTGVINTWASVASSSAGTDYGNLSTIEAQMTDNINFTIIVRSQDSGYTADVVLFTLGWING